MGRDSQTLRYHNLTLTVHTIGLYPIIIHQIVIINSMTIFDLLVPNLAVANHT